MKFRPELVQDAWSKIYRHPELLPKDKYIVIGGNEYCGAAYTKEELIANWRKCLRFAHNQDISIYLNGKLIRSVINFDGTILGRLRFRGLNPSKIVKTEYIKHHYVAL